MLWTKMWKSGTRWQFLSKRRLALFFGLLFLGGTILSGCSSQGGMVQAETLEDETARRKRHRITVISRETRTGAAQENFR